MLASLAQALQSASAQAKFPFAGGHVMLRRDVSPRVLLVHAEPSVAQVASETIPPRKTLDEGNRPFRQELSVNIGSVTQPQVQQDLLDPGQLRLAAVVLSEVVDIGAAVLHLHGILATSTYGQSVCLLVGNVYVCHVMPSSAVP